MKSLTLPRDLFEKSVLEVNTFLDYFKSNAISQLLEKAEAPNQRDFLNYFLSFDGTTIHYNALIISVYGAFEHFIDSIFSAYLEIIFSEIPNYEQLPEKIRRKYQEKLGEYLTNPQRFNILDTSVPTVIENYSKILKSDYTSLSDKEFVLSHPANLKSEQIFRLMNEIGIAKAKESFFSSFLLKEFFVNSLGYEESDFDLKAEKMSSELVYYLDNIVEQRNFVGHGRMNPTRISQNDLKNKYFPYLILVSEILLRILMSEISTLLIQKKNPPWITPIAVYDNCIVCLHIDNTSLKKGDFIIYQTGDEIFVSRVLSIQINREDVSAISGLDCDIGLKIAGRIKEYSKVFYFVPR